MTKGRLKSKLAFHGQRREQPVEKAKPQKDYFNKLPPEIIINIFLIDIEGKGRGRGRLTIEEEILEYTTRIDHLESVCRYWSSIIRDFIIYSEHILYMKTLGSLYTANHTLNSGTMGDTMKKYRKNIKHLSLDHGKESSGFIKNLAPIRSDKLTPVSLTIHSKDHKSSTGDNLWRDIEECIDTSKLTLLDMQTPNFKTPIGPIGSCKYLTSLLLGGQLPIRDVINCLKCTPNLEYLSLDYLVDSRGAVTEYDSTPQSVELKSLRKLEVRHFLTVLHRFIKRLSLGESMHDLCLYDASTTDIGYLAGQMNLAENLENLSLTFRSLPVDATIGLLRKYTKLRRLTLGGFRHVEDYCGIIKVLGGTSAEDHGGESLCPMLQHLVLLTYSKPESIKQDILKQLKNFVPAAKVYISGEGDEPIPLHHRQSEGVRVQLVDLFRMDKLLQAIIPKMAH